jgi:hypothetical protein
MANEFVLRKGLISLGGVTFPLTQVNGTYTVLPTDYFVEATGNDFVPAFMLIENYDSETPTTGLFAPDRDFEDIDHGLKIIKEFYER